MPAPQSSSVNPLSSGNLIQRYSDVLIAVAIVTIVIMMIIPLPTILLDILICLNITIALLVVMSAIYNVEALDLSVFPSLLLAMPVRLLLRSETLSSAVMPSSALSCSLFSSL